MSSKYDMRINELFAGGADWEWIGRTRSLSKAKFTVEDQDYEVWFAGDLHAVHIGFMWKRDEKYSMGTTGTGNAAQVMSTVIAIIKSFVDETQPPEFYFSGNGASRVRLYTRMATRLASMAPGYTMTSYDEGDARNWSFTRK